MYNYDIHNTGLNYQLSEEEGVGIYLNATTYYYQNCAV